MIEIPKSHSLFGGGQGMPGHPTGSVRRAPGTSAQPELTGEVGFPITKREAELLRAPADTEVTFTEKAALLLLNSGNGVVSERQRAVLDCLWERGDLDALRQQQPTGSSEARAINAQIEDLKQRDPEVFAESLAWLRYASTGAPPTES